MKNLLHLIYLYRKMNNTALVSDSRICWNLLLERYKFKWSQNGPWEHRISASPVKIYWKTSIFWKYVFLTNSFKKVWSIELFPSIDVSLVLRIIIIEGFSFVAKRLPPSPPLRLHYRSQDYLGKWKVNFLFLN